MAAWTLLLAIGLGGPAKAESTQLVDLNRATVEELTALPGIGPAKAQAIIEHRGNAPFKKPEELLQVRGIGDALYAQLKGLVTVGPAAAGADTPGGEAGAEAGAAEGKGTIAPQARADRASAR